MCVCARALARGEPSPQEKRRDEPVMVVKGVKRGSRRDGRGREGRGCAEGGGEEYDECPGGAGRGWGVDGRGMGREGRRREVRSWEVVKYTVNLAPPELKRLRKLSPLSAVFSTRFTLHCPK